MRLLCRSPTEHFHVARPRLLHDRLSLLERQLDLTFVHDPVAAIDVIGLVAADLHGDGLARAGRSGGEPPAGAVNGAPPTVDIPNRSIGRQKPRLLNTLIMCKFSPGTDRAVQEG